MLGQSVIDATVVLMFAATKHVWERSFGRSRRGLSQAREVAAKLLVRFA
jgi:hypothetical protein